MLKKALYAGAVLGAGYVGLQWWTASNLATHARSSRAEAYVRSAFPGAAPSERTKRVVEVVKVKAYDPALEAALYRALPKAHMMELVWAQDAQGRWVQAKATLDPEDSGATVISTDLAKRLGASASGGEEGPVVVLSVLGTEFSQPVRVAGGGGGLLAALNPFAHEVRVTRPMLQALEEKAAAAKQ